MADGGSQTPQRPLTGLIADAKSGNLSVRMDLDKFVYLDRDCNYFKLQIRKIQTQLDEISQQKHWGLGEDHVADGARDLVSAKTMVARWKSKARGAGGENSFYDQLDSHWQTIDDFQTLFRAVREQMIGEDQAQAAKYKQLESTLAQQAPAPERWLGAGLVSEFQ